MTTLTDLITGDNKPNFDRLTPEELYKLGNLINMTVEILYKQYRRTRKPDVWSKYVNAMLAEAEYREYMERRRSQ